MQPLSPAVAHLIWRYTEAHSVDGNLLAFHADLAIGDTSGNLYFELFSLLTYFLVALTLRWLRSAPLNRNTERALHKLS